MRAESDKSCGLNLHSWSGGRKNPVAAKTGVLGDGSQYATAIAASTKAKHHATVLIRTSLNVSCVGMSATLNTASQATKVPIHVATLALTSRIAVSAEAFGTKVTSRVDVERRAATPNSN
jgi:hypothetical protein